VSEKDDLMSAAAVPVADVILVAAGSGTRLGAAVPKAFLEVFGAPLIVHALRHVEAVSPRRVVITVPAADPDHWIDFISGLSLPGDVEAVPGGETRQASVRAGLVAVAHRCEAAQQAHPDVVLVHDAARPCASERLWRLVCESALELGAAIPVLPATDCLKRLNARGEVEETLDRGTVGHAQTPQAFRFDWLVAAHRDAGPLPAADDAELVERLGMIVATVPGEKTNLKVTTAADIEIIESLLCTDGVSGS
jgi:2-C-methyl-D-erythritol 4-phosphate cytidylyltransferase